MAEDAERCARRAARWAAAAAGPPPVTASGGPPPLLAPKRKRNPFVVQPHTSPDHSGRASSLSGADSIQRRPDAPWARKKKQLEQATAGATLQANMGKGCDDVRVTIVLIVPACRWTVLYVHVDGRCCLKQQADSCVVRRPLPGPNVRTTGCQAPPG